jgi:hypothetical protein
VDANKKHLYLSIHILNFAAIGVRACCQISADSPQTKLHTRTEAQAAGIQTQVLSVQACRAAAQ